MPRTIPTIDARVASLRTVINWHRQIASDDAYYYAERKRLTENRDFFQRGLDRLEDSRANGEALITGVQDEIHALLLEKRTLSAGDDIEKLLRLQEQVVELEAAIGPAKVAEEGGAS